MTTGLCPEILTEDLLNILRRELNMTTVKDFLSTEPEKMIEIVGQSDGKRSKVTTDKPLLSLKDIWTIRSEIFSKFSIVAKNLGDELSKGRLCGGDCIVTGLLDLVRIRPGRSACLCIHF